MGFPGVEMTNGERQRQKAAGSINTPQQCLSKYAVWAIFFFINTWKLLRPQFLSHPFVLESHREEPSPWCRGRQEPFQKNASQSEAWETLNYANNAGALALEGRLLTLAQGRAGCRQQWERRLIPLNQNYAIQGRRGDPVSTLLTL